MKHKQFKIIALFFLCLSLNSLYAQESTNVAGGMASGSGGSVSYSIGQVAYQMHEGSLGSNAQGVQQPYEILVVTGIEMDEIKLGISAYPNPTTDYLTLKIENAISLNMSYQLFDINGQLVLYEEIQSSATQIPMNNLAPASYYLKVIENKKTIKNFKIVKN